MYEYKIILKIKDVEEEFIFYSDYDLKSGELKKSMEILKRVYKKPDVNYDANVDFFKEIFKMK